MTTCRRGRTDADLKNFSLAPDNADVIPVLKEVLTINPKVKILASPLDRSGLDEGQTTM